MAAKKSNPGFEFIKDQLKKNKNVSYAEVKAAADKKKLAVFPIMFGRAQAVLGYVKVSPRGEGKAAQARAARNTGADAGAPPMKRGPGRPRKQPIAAMDTGSLDGIIAAVKTSQQEKDRYRAALEKIQQVLESVMV